MPEYEIMWGDVTRRSDEREHYHDRAKRAAEAGLELGVYVDAGQIAHIARGSGIVGSPATGAPSMVVDYEGNLYGSSNMSSWAERVYHAASRHVTAYPTVARSHVDPSWLQRIGTYEIATDRIRLDDRDALLAWVGDDEYADLLITKEGTVLTDAAMRHLADEAERGYDVSKFKRRNR